MTKLSLDMERDFYRRYFAPLHNSVRRLRTYFKGTNLLWGLPIALVLLGAMVVVLMIRARRNASAKALSAEERQRIDALTNHKGSS